LEILEQESVWLDSLGGEMLDILGVKKDDFVIDFGCGKGRYTIPLSQIVGQNGNVFAVERNLDDVVELRERISVYGGKGSINIINLEDIKLESVGNGVIDCVLAFDVLQYVEDWEKFFNTVRRVLKPCGTIHVYPAAVPHPGAIEIEKLLTALESTGFKACGKRMFRMMHNIDIVDDEVYSFSLCNYKFGA